MKKLIFLVSVLLITVVCFSQKQKADAYIALYKDIAMNEMIRTGVPASITLAQGILESQYGESQLCKQSNNHFGIKCKEEWTGDKVYHDDDRKQECFRVYQDAATSFKDHSDFLKNRPYYTSLFLLSPTDYEGWAYGLKKAGYATEKNYPQMLIKIINDNNLNQYSIAALQQKQNNNSFVSLKTVEEPQPVFIPAVQQESKTVSSIVEKETVEITSPAKKDNAIIAETNNYPEGIFNINHTKVIYAKDGTSLLSIANQYDIALSKLFEFNDMEETDVLTSNKLIFIEKKMKKGASDFHIVKDNETLYDICQKEGVRLENILAYNGLKQNMQPVTGEKIYLRDNAPVHPKTVATTNSTNKSTSKK
jgi:LysM repeat protein